MNAQPFYGDFFGLAERPFTLLPDPGFLFWSKPHQRAFAMLEYGLMTGAPVTLITGEIGAGKTTLLQALLARVETDITVGLISNAQGGRGELLQWVLHAFDIPSSPDTPYVQNFRLLQNFLIDEYANGRRCLLIVDEAQNLSVEGLEEVRMLTNINTNKDELIQLILVGQPELRDIIRAPEMRQLAQRVAASFHLPAMDPETVAEYIAHRLRTAGGRGDEISPGIALRIHSLTGGVPRLVNQLCDLALTYAWVSEQAQVTEETIAAVLEDGVFFAAGTHPEAEGHKERP
ncbi:AAA family ATPase [Frigidibacter sp. MR17.14]|uniref:ExeA family protein n=1 Tax=Frigidibacter sp. MR17.14 TaxID=3126509 RepID=UPI003012BD9E